MLVSYKWLQEYVDIADISAEDLAEKITRSGIEVEGIEDLGQGISGVVVGHVLECEQHPNADKLNVCQVDIGEEETKQIICGAPNVAKGQKVVVAKVGAVLPGNFKIKKAKLRGEVSEGMICSLQELGVESKFVPKEYAEGIFVFADEAEVGADALDYLNLNDKVLELGLTPNRSDCLNMFGVAYEVAAILGRDVKLPDPQINETTEKAADYIKVTVENNEDNPYYGARIVKNVKIGPSPLWMQTRLMAAGIRPISNVVDITNYILLEYGQPLHAFDYDKLGSKEIVVRRATPGEKIKTLDDQERTLQEDHLVITNGKVPVAMAGVMGGADSEVGNDTTTVLIESAVFSSALVRKASKDHSLRSEASARFEKGIDPLRSPASADRAAQLMAQYAGGEVLAGIVEANTLTIEPTTVAVSTSRVNQVLGTEISESEIESIFTKLQFAFDKNNGNFYVNVPTRRGDITIPEDLIEEVARLYGYDNLPSTLPVGQAIPGKLSDHQQKRRLTRRYLEGVGLYQAVTYSLTSEEKAKKFASEDDLDSKPIHLSMPMSEERSTLRLSLVPHLLEVAAHNKARQIDSVAVYEIASVFTSKENTISQLPEEKERLAGAVTGLWENHPWQAEKKPVDFFIVKGILEGLFRELRIDKKITFEQLKKDGLHPGRAAAIYLDGDNIGFVGQVHPEEQKALDINETYVFELSIEKLFVAASDHVIYEQIPRFPSTSRDIALVVDEDVAAGTIEKVIIEAGGELLKHVSVFDVYQGEHLEAGKKSVAFSLRYFDPTRTLTDEDVAKAHDNVLKAVEEKLSAKLRG